MITYPNQKIVTIHKDDNDPFLQVGVDTWIEASNILSPMAFKLYLLMASNQNEYTFALSYESICSRIPMSRKTYEKAIKELREYNFLTCTGGNKWDFTTEPL